ncbi:Uu.00g135660.m01.CDS01 [Anthostomella pinea]|uniref:Uu.00g135660.m01.CDS01 n=1 Tax=Anthostomella pinea TaxID=933095 RepID=A0AAI8VP88_9PEZI|nr:Uu.00g135660.m01.CDS01 [Anthostomella pinea]
MAMPEDQHKNLELFQDCLSTALIEKISQPQSKPKKRTKSTKKRPVSVSSPSKSKATTTRHDDDNNETTAAATPSPSATTTLDDETTAEDLADFTDYIATSTFQSLPPELKTLDYWTYSKSPALQSRYALPLTGADVPGLLPTLDPSVADSLAAYGITREPAQGVDEFLAPVLTAFLTALFTAPPPPSSTRDVALESGCEICGRDWIGLNYHHLIPRFVHAKALKRGWHREEDLQNVAWLCGACHKFVHRFADHEELARKYYTVELLMQEEEVQRWAGWVGRLRWKGR